METTTMTDMAPEPSTLSLEALPPSLRKRLEGMGIQKASDLPAPPDSHSETAEEARERLALQARNRSKRWRERLPRSYAEAAIADLDPEQREAIQRWIADRSVLTLVLAGEVGTGKTHAAYAIGNYAVAHGAWVEAWTVYDLLTAMRPDGDPNAYQRAVDVPLLVLDDLGVGKASEWAVDTLTTLLGARVAARRRTVVTTNANSDLLREELGPRLVDRLMEDSAAVVFRGASRRKAAW